MKVFLFSLVLLLFFPVSIFANESSEDILSVYEACAYSDGSHLPHIEGIERSKISQNLLNLMSNNYSTEGFYKYNNRVYTVVFDSTLPRNYAILISKSCINGIDTGIQIHGYESHIQYSPSVTKVGTGYVILNDWQNISGKSYHVSIVYDDQRGVFYMRDEFLKKNPKIVSYVKKNIFFWDVLEYKNGVALIEVRLNPDKKRNFSIKIPIKWGY